MYSANIGLVILGALTFAGVVHWTGPSLAKPTPLTAPAAPSQQECLAFCGICDACYASDRSANKSCRFLMGQQAGGQEQCQAECARGETPSVVQRGALGKDWAKLSCEQLASTL
ncbi:MAG TPA: hypothetical protein VHP33_35260 [Polyangiaceae bacterium]|nr:hypothetical protein [Polyangiaceae bacterium]